MRLSLLTMALVLAPALLPGSAGGAADTALSTQTYPCSLAEGACANDFVLDLLPEDRRGTRRQWRIGLDTTVLYDGEGRLRYAGVLEWSAQVWNGRTWEPETRFISSPWNREHTAVLVSKSTRVRVKVQVATGYRPPAVDIPVYASSLIQTAY